MPYNRGNLPKNIKDPLPAQAQDIWVEAFNNAFNNYDRPSKRRGDASREETAAKVAWSAVKKKYTKGDDGKWHAK